MGLPALSVHDAKTYRTIGKDVMAEVDPATLSYCVAVSEDRGTLLRISYTEGVEPVPMYTDRYHRLYHTLSGRTGDRSVPYRRSGQ